MSGSACTALALRAIVPSDMISEIILSWQAMMLSLFLHDWEWAKNQHHSHHTVQEDSKETVALAFECYPGTPILRAYCH